MRHSLGLLCLLAFFILSRAELSSWKIAQWDRPRAALIRDNIYLDGGWIMIGNWTDGKWADTTDYRKDSILKLNLHEPFDIKGATPAVFQTVEEGDPQVTWLDGWMFADWDEFYIYG